MRFAGVVDNASSNAARHRLTRHGEDATRCISTEKGRQLLPQLVRRARLRGNAALPSTGFLKEFVPQ